MGRTTPLSEDSLIRLIRRTSSTRDKVNLGIGDDACILRNGTIVTIDSYADHVHFDLGYMTWRQVGARCACAATSDVIAMAGRPEAVLVALALTRCTRRANIRALYRGINDVCSTMGCEVAGGDIIVADGVSLTLAVTGQAAHPKLRSDAEPGDSVYVTGMPGVAEAGRLLLSGRVAATGRGEGFRDMRQRHLLPLPRLSVVTRLSSRIHALIDTSDGLATDARHICERSRVKLVLEAESIPIGRGVIEVCRMLRRNPLEFVITAGEDYELLMTSAAAMPVAVAGVKLTRIGRVMAGSGLFIENGGRIIPLVVKGYDHLSRQ